MPTSGMSKCDVGGAGAGYRARAADVVAERGTLGVPDGTGGAVPGVVADRTIRSNPSSEVLNRISTSPFCAGLRHSTDAPERPRIILSAARGYSATSAESGRVSHEETKSRSKTSRGVGQVE